MVARNYFYHSFIHEKQKLRMSSGIYAEVGQEEVRTADSKSLSLFFFFFGGRQSIETRRRLRRLDAGGEETGSFSLVTHRFRIGRQAQCKDD